MFPLRKIRQTLLHGRRVSRELSHDRRIGAVRFRTEVKSFRRDEAGTAVCVASAVCAVLFPCDGFQRLSVISFHVSLLRCLLADFAIDFGIAWLPGREAVDVAIEHAE